MSGSGAAAIAGPPRPWMGKVVALGAGKGDFFAALPEGISSYSLSRYGSSYSLSRHGSRQTDSDRHPLQDHPSLHPLICSPKPNLRYRLKIPECGTEFIFTKNLNWRQQELEWRELLRPVE